MSAIKPPTIEVHRYNNNGVSRKEYSCLFQAAAACEMFNVAGQQVRQGEHQGFVSLNGQLDYEQKRSYTMTILAAVRNNIKSSMQNFSKSFIFFPQQMTYFFT